MSQDLAELQQIFQQYLLTGETAIASLIRKPRNSNIKDRLAVYGDGYRTRLCECLEDDFSSFKAYAGDELFFQVCNDYIDAFPSTSKSLSDYGNHFVEFINHQADFQQGFLGELAHFEWSMMSVLNLPLEVPASINNLQDVPQHEWPNMRFQLQSNHRLNHYHWNVVECWQALNKSQYISERFQKQNVCLIWRKQYFARFKVLTSSELLIYQLMKSGSCFAVIGQALCEVIPEAEVPGSLLQTIMMWLDDGLISKIIS